MLPLELTREPPHSDRIISRGCAPCGAITGVGSLPFREARLAVDFVAQTSPEIPFWPQLPQRSGQESLIAQGLAILADFLQPRHSAHGFEVKPGNLDRVLAALHRSQGELPGDAAAGFATFEADLAAQRFPAARAVKGQIEGPITLATYLFHSGRPFLASSELFAALAYHVSQTICWQVARLQAAGLPVFIFVDEPALCLDGPPRLAVPEAERLRALAATLTAARLRGALAGLHCCAASPFDRMCSVEADILSFDAHAGLEAFFENSAARDFARSGGIVAYGLIPTHQSLDRLSAASLFTRWLQQATLAGDPQHFARHAMVTATCGLGLLDEPAAHQSFRLAGEVSSLFRRLAGSDPVYPAGS